MRQRFSLLLVVLLLVFFLPARAQRLPLDSVRAQPGYGPTSFRLIRPDFISKNQGLFCRKEWQLQKATSLAFRFRLGSVEYTDRMEGKGNYFFFNHSISGTLTGSRK